MKSISDIFNKIAGNNQQQAAVTTTVDPSKPQTVVVDPNVKNPAAFPEVKKDETSPMAGFDSLWLTDAKDGKPPELSTVVGADPKKLMEAAQTIDFTKGIDPALLAAVAKGNDPESLGKLMNAVGQLGYAQATGATARIVTAALDAQARKFTTEYFPELMRRTEATRLLGGENPIFLNPAIKPMLAMLETQLANKFPMASAADISAKAKQYVVEMSTAVLTENGMTISEKPKEDPLALSKKDTDWATLFGIEPGAAF